MTEPYQTTLKQQAVLYAGLDNNDANGGQIYHQNSILTNQNLIAQSHRGALNDTRSLKANKKTFLKQNGRFIEARPSNLHPKIPITTANPFLNCLSKK